jgi:hypothetical protein
LRENAGIPPTLNTVDRDDRTVRSKRQQSGPLSERMKLDA